MNRLFITKMRQLCVGMSVLQNERSSCKTYEDAVTALNSLQSNAAYLAQNRKERDQKRHLNLPETIEFAERAGVTLDDIDSLSVIHVSGTKGKGSTCAYCESILRSYGYKTGFFSSPHLVEVRERIRIGGKPLSKDQFTKYFWQCFTSLQETQEQHDGKMPAYFKFLTILAYYVFLQEQVDVAVIEVGIGGQYDCTNIVRQPVACGVSNLGIDHVALLGDTIEKIAWHKAGIFKPGVPAYVVSQPEGAMQVLQERAVEIGCPIFQVPALPKYNWHGRPIELGISGSVQQTNASLAMQLCHTWMANHNKCYEERVNLYRNGFYPEALTEAEPFTVTHQMVEGLKQCRWNGRNQVIKKKGITYYVDGAHTAESIAQCVEWFKVASEKECSNLSGDVVKILIFNMSGERPAEKLLRHLVPLQLDCAVFCTNNTFANSASNADQTNYTVSLESQLGKCSKHAELWKELLSVTSSAVAKAAHSTGQKSHTSNNCDSRQSGSRRDMCFTCVSIQEAANYASQGRDPLVTPCYNVPCELQQLVSPAAHVQVLCTGSLHLVGGVLRLVYQNVEDRC